MKLLFNIKSVLLSGYNDLQNPTTANIPGLDFLRTIAIILVLSTHYYSTYTSKVVGFNTELGNLPLFLFGWTGVDLFFVLSGFLIGKQLWKELNTSGTIKVPRFLIRRGLRIWPYYYSFILFVFLTHSTPIKDYIPDLLFLSNYMHNHIAGGWSLSTEEQFYILMPILLLLGVKLIPIRHGYLIPLTLFILLPVGRALIYTAQTGVITEELREHLTYTYIHTHADGLIAGLMISWASVVKKDFFRKLPFKRNILLPICLVIIGIVLRITNNFVFAFSSLALIFSAAVIFVARDNSILSVFFRWNGFHYLSRFSFGMYLNHFLVLYWCMPVFLTLPYSHTQIGFWLEYLLIIMISSLIACLSFLLIESPFLQLREHIYRGKP